MAGHKRSGCGDSNDGSCEKCPQGKFNNDANGYVYQCEVCPDGTTTYDENKCDPCKTNAVGTGGKCETTCTAEEGEVPSIDKTKCMKIKSVTSITSLVRNGQQVSYTEGTTKLMFGDTVRFDVEMQNFEHCQDTSNLVFSVEMCTDSDCLARKGNSLTYKTCVQGTGCGDNKALASITAACSSAELSEYPKIIIRDSEKTCFSGGQLVYIAKTKVVTTKQNIPPSVERPTLFPSTIYPTTLFYRCKLSNGIQDEDGVSLETHTLKKFELVQGTSTANKLLFKMVKQSLK